MTGGDGGSGGEGMMMWLTRKPVSGCKMENQVEKKGRRTGGGMWNEEDVKEEVKD